MKCDYTHHNDILPKDEDLFQLAEKHIYQTDKYSNQSKYNFLLKLFDKAEIINIKEF